MHEDGELKCTPEASTSPKPNRGRRLTTQMNWSVTQTIHVEPHSTCYHIFPAVKNLVVKTNIKQCNARLTITLCWFLCWSNAGIITFQLQVRPILSNMRQKKSFPCIAYSRTTHATPLSFPLHSHQYISSAHKLFSHSPQHLQASPHNIHLSLPQQT